MPELKVKSNVPTPADDAAIVAASMAAPDAAPFMETDWAQVKLLVCGGHPLGRGTKVHVALCLDMEMVEDQPTSGVSGEHDTATT